MKNDLKLLTDQMNELKDMKAKLEFELKNCEKNINEVELELQNILRRANVDSMDYGIYTFGWKTVTSRRFNQKAFGEAHPDLLEQFKLPTKSKRFEFKING